jgi:hypothetical protein
MEKWIDRYTVRLFDDTQPVSAEHIAHLKGMFEHLPTQQSINNNLWFTLTPEHDTLKVWLLENVYNHFDNHGQFEYMVQVLSAPLVFLSSIFTNNLNTEPVSYHDANRNIGLHAGVLMEESLGLGYDVATIGCTNRYMQNEDDLRPLYQAKMEEYFLCDIQTHTGLTDYSIEPNLAVCIGAGVPLEPDFTFSTYRGYRYAAFQKDPKEWTGVI